MQKKRYSKKIMNSRKHFCIFDEIDNKCNKLNIYKPRTTIKINAKSAMLLHLKIIESKLIYS